MRKASLIFLWISIAISIIFVLLAFFSKVNILLLQILLTLMFSFFLTGNIISIVRRKKNNQRISFPVFVIVLTTVCGILVTFLNVT